MTVTPSGMTTEVRAVQESKAAFPMAVTPSGMTTEVRLRHSRKAPSPISVTPSGKGKAVSAVLTDSSRRPVRTPSAYRYFSLQFRSGSRKLKPALLTAFAPSDPVCAKRPTLPPLSRKKAWMPTSVTPSGMVREGSSLQLRKACAPMTVTLSGMVKSVRLQQPKKELVSMTVTLDPSVTERSPVQ